MDALGAKPPLDRAIAALAGRQHGVITRAQLAALGAGRGAVEKRVQRGRLHRIHRGVYAVGHRVLTRNGTLIAAVLACGDGAVLSHRSAAELWSMGPQAAYLDVTVPGRRRPPGIVVHECALREGDRTTLHGIPVTTPARTIIDLADILTARGLERRIDEAEYLRLDLTGLEPIPGRRGAGALARLLAEHKAGSTRTRSTLEELFLNLCETHDLTQPEQMSEWAATRSTSYGPARG